jgi:hypothetical protein
VPPPDTSNLTGIDGAGNSPVLIPFLANKKHHESSGYMMLLFIPDNIQAAKNQM